MVRTLESDIDQHRAAARAELRVRPTTEVLAALDGWLSANKDHPNLQHHRLEALWVQQHHRSVQQPLLEQLLTSPEPKARAAAVRALCYLRDEFKSSTDWFVRAAHDEHPRVRLEAVRAASFLAGADGDRVLNAALEHPLDYYLQYTITETSDTLEMRGGRPGGTSAAAVERLAAGEVPDAQVLPLVQLSVTNADARAFGRLFAATMEPKAYSVSTKLAVIRLLQREAEVRKLLPPVRKDKFLDQIRTALSASDVPLAAALLQLAEAWKIPDLVSDMRTLILEQRPDPAVVSAALGIVAADTSPGAGMLLNELSTNPQNPKLTVQVAQAMSGRDAKRAITILIRGLEQGAGFEDTRPAIEALLRQQNGSKELTKALRGGKLSPDPARVLLRALFAVGNSDQDLAAVVSEAAGINSKSEPLTDAQRIALARRIDQEGDAEAGQWVFRRTELNCTKCHMLSGGGGNIGPDLSAVGANSPTEYLIDSMLHPSKQIKEAFLTRKILTTSGQVVVGIRVDANDQRVVLRDIEGKEVTIAQNDIEEDLEGPSLMPEGLANFLTEREFIDLVKFLSVLGKPGPYAINNRLTAQRFWLLTDQQIRKDLAKAEEGKLESSLASLSKIVYEPRLALVDGRLPKAEIVPADVQLPIILRFDFKVTVAGALGIRVEPASDVQLVINGQSLSPSGQQAIDLPAGDHSAFLIYERNAPTADITVELVRPSATTIQVSRP